jgi:hypothetical protein
MKSYRGGSGKLWDDFPFSRADPSASFWFVRYGCIVGTKLEKLIVL